jgi:hypothetical protein
MTIICKKKKCISCKNINTLFIQCNWCSNHYCTKCIQQEYHHCEKLTELIKDMNSNLKNTLENQKCVSKKVIKI